MEEQIWQLEARAAASLRVNKLVNASMGSAPDLAFQEDVSLELEKLKAGRKAV